MDSLNKLIEKECRGLKMRRVYKLETDKYQTLMYGNETQRKHLKLSGNDKLNCYI